MRENGYLESTLEEVSARDVLQSKKIQKVYTTEPTAKLRDVVAQMKSLDVSQLPVVDGGTLVGIVTEVDLLNHMLFAPNANHADETITGIIDTDVTTVSPDTPMETLMSVFATAGVAVVMDGGAATGILTKIDLLDFLSGRVG